MATTVKKKKAAKKAASLKAKMKFVDLEVVLDGGFRAHFGPGHTHRFYEDPVNGLTTLQVIKNADYSIVFEAPLHRVLAAIGPTWTTPLTS